MTTYTNGQAVQYQIAPGEPWVDARYVGVMSNGMHVIESGSVRWVLPASIRAKPLPMSQWLNSQEFLSLCRDYRDPSYDVLARFDALKAAILEHSK